MGVRKRKGCEIPPLKSQRLQRLLVFEYNPARSRIDHVMFVFVSQVRKKRAIDASVGEFKKRDSGYMSTVARPSKGPSQKKKFV